MPDVFDNLLADPAAGTAPRDDAVPETQDTASLDAASDESARLPVTLRPLRERHRRFALEYIIDLNGAAAAARAGYAKGKAGGRAAELLRRPEVIAFIRAELDAREERTRVTGERVIREIARIGFADPSRICSWGPDGVTLVPSERLSEDDKAAVKWISIGGSKSGRVQRFELHDKVAALELLARLTGVLTRAPGQGRFAVLAPSPQEQEAQERQDDEARAKLRRLMLNKIEYHAEQKFQAMLAAWRAREVVVEEGAGI